MSVYFLFPLCSTVRCGANRLPCGSIGNVSGNCQETETCMVRAYHTPRQPLQNHPSGQIGGWAMPWSAQEMLDGQYQTADILALTGQKCSQWPAAEKQTGTGSLLNRPRVAPPLPRRPNWSRDWTEPILDVYNMWTRTCADTCRNPRAAFTNPLVCPSSRSGAQLDQRPPVVHCLNHT